jgi:hypothetical protein
MPQKKFDSSKKVTATDLEILKEGRLSASSYGFTQSYYY